MLRLGFPPDLVPYNSDNRRNVGYFMAAESGADFLISIDDDNYCPANEDYFAEHSIVCGEPRRHDVVDSNNGWYNFCDLLELEPAVDAIGWAVVRGQAGQEHQRRAGSQAQIRHPSPRALPDLPLKA